MTINLRCIHCFNLGAVVKSFEVTLGEIADNQDITFDCTCTNCGHTGRESFKQLAKLAGEADESAAAEATQGDLFSQTQAAG